MLDALNTGRSTIRGKPEYRDRDGVINDDRDDRGFGSRFGGRDPRGYDRRGGYTSRPPYDDWQGGGGRGGYDDRYGGRRDYDGRDRYAADATLTTIATGATHASTGTIVVAMVATGSPPRGRYEDRGRFGGDRYGDRRGSP